MPHVPGAIMSRRRFLPAICAASGLLASRESWSQTPELRRLDLHHHFAPPKFKALLAEGKRQGWQAFQPYDPRADLEAMDQGGVATAFLSATTPGLYNGDEFAPERERVIALARDMNEYAARLMQDFKG